jgi:streptogramin lyase
MRPRNLSSAASLAVVLLAACGGGGDDAATTLPDGASGLPDDVVVLDLSGGAGGSAPDGAAEDGSAPEPGTFGSPCERASDCESGHCVASARGFTCSEGCVESCRPGFTCVGTASPGGDIAFVCLERPALLCQPCTRDADCNLGASAGNRCLDRGPEGRFCGVSCATDAGCPDGYACEGAQCAPRTGSCSCNGLGAALGRTTTCSVSNGFGACEGSRSCKADGLSACEVAPAVVETCNGRDDDCDGAIDEELPAVPCPTAGGCGGLAVCQGGALVCIGGAASAEICNGVDDDCDGEVDEGFPDLDRDGARDCSDDDDDGDTWPDAADCAPLDASRHPGAVERCDGVDNDCNFLADEADAEGCSPYLRDLDADGYGDPGAGARCLCGPDTMSGHVASAATGEDCDDLAAAANPAASERCDEADNDCDGQVDEGVQSPCGGCGAVCVLNAGPRGETPLDTSESPDGGLAVAPGGGLTLGTNTEAIPFIWVANSAANTVSRLDTTTGREVGRYAVCTDPSRTAVDLFGDGIIACRGDGRVAKIAISLSDCVDRNGNGAIDTARDDDGDGVIQDREQRGNDECVLWNVQPDGASSTSCNAGGTAGCARAAGVDRDNNVWIGLWHSQRLVQLDGRTGATLRALPLTMRPYGLAIDADGLIWVASRAPNALGKVHPVNGQLSSHSLAWPKAVYGLAIDHRGAVWVATGENRGVSRFNPVDASWTHFGPWDSRGYTRGVAVRLVRGDDGQVSGSQVFVAHHEFSRSCGSNPSLDRTVTMLDTTTGAELRALDLGAPRGPVGVALDPNGKLWTVNECTSDVTRVDPDTGAVLGTWPVGRNPYTYSDMTGYALRTITSRTGYHRQTFEGWASGVTRWTAIFVDADLPGSGETWARLRYRAADTAGALQAAAWSQQLGPYPPAPLPASVDVTGRLLQVEVTLGTGRNGLAPVLRGVSAIAARQ